MKALVVALVSWVSLLALAAPARAQLGEIQLGAVVSYGDAQTLREGAGAVAGVALGRIVYFGLRWVYYAGSTSLSRDVTPVESANRAQLFVADLGLLVPVAGLEVVPGISLGMLRYNQRVASVSQHATEFVVAPGMAVHAHIGPVVVIPQIEYFFAGKPDLTAPVDRRGVATSLRIVIPIEVGRIRY